MGRGIRLIRYDPFWESDTVQRIRDDRYLIERAKSVKDIERYVAGTRRGGAVYDEMIKSSMVKRVSNGVEVDKTEVQRRAETLTKTVVNQRFESYKRYREEIREQAEQQGISERQSRNISNRETEIEARAVLTAARLGNVKLSAYETGILKKLADGKFEDVVYGEADEDGRRKYERGTYFTQLGFDRREQQRQRGYRGETTEARRDEQRRNFLEYTGGGRPTGNVNFSAVLKSFGRK